MLLYAVICQVYFQKLHNQHRLVMHILLVHQGRVDLQEMETLTEKERVCHI